MGNMGDCCPGKVENKRNEYELVAMEKDVYLKSEHLYCPEIYCNKCRLDLPERKSKNPECEKTYSTVVLKQFLKDCQPYFQALRKHNGGIENRDDFSNFIHSGRLWILHTIHSLKCDEDLDKDIALDGLEEWFITLLEVYSKNIYSPSNTFQYPQPGSFVPKTFVDSTFLKHQIMLKPYSEINDQLDELTQNLLNCPVPPDHLDSEKPAEKITLPPYSLEM